MKNTTFSQKRDISKLNQLKNQIDWLNKEIENCNNNDYCNLLKERLAIIDNKWFDFYKTLLDDWFQFDDNSNIINF